MIRFFDILFSSLALIVLSPLLLIVAFMIVLESRGGAFFFQKRTGKSGKEFYLWKFRSMHIGSEKKGYLTVGKRDPRITKTGYFIRKYKVDELPQLVNVIKGDMSIVGPRPEVKKYVDLYTEEQRVVLNVKPGITDYASIMYRSENEILDKSIDPEKTYIEEIMPEKIRLNKIFINDKGLQQYFRIIICTVYNIFRQR